MAGCETGRRGFRWLVGGVFLALAMITGGTYLYHHGKEASRPVDSPPSGSFSLSRQTLGLLAQLNVPVEIRYYSILDSNHIPFATQKFAERVERLLKAYARESRGRVKVVCRHGDSDMAAAAADGLQAFNVDVGEPCFLGIVVTAGGKKELLNPLAPDWEPALEFDLSRALARVTQTPSVTTPSPAPVAAASAEAIKRLLPDVESIPVDEGVRRLRERAMSEFRQVSKDLEARMQELERRLAGGAGAAGEDSQKVRKQILDLQNEHTEKLKAIAARLQEQVTALEQMKRR